MLAPIGGLTWRQAGRTWRGMKGRRRKDGPHLVTDAALKERVKQDAEITAAAQATVVGWVESDDLHKSGVGEYDPLVETAKSLLADDLGSPTEETDIRAREARKSSIEESKTPGYNIDTMDAAARIKAAAELLSSVYPAERVGRALKDLAAETARETTGRAKEAPRPDWIEARARGVTLTDFIAEKFEAELRDGTMTRALLNRFDKLPSDFYGYPRHHDMPEWLKAIPTKAEWDKRHAPEPVRTDEVRRYERETRRLQRLSDISAYETD